MRYKLNMLFVIIVIYYITSKLPVQSWTKKIHLFIPDETGWKIRFSGKKRFLMAILKFSEKTGSRFLGPFDFTIHYHRTWMFTIRVLKISQLNLDLLTKNRFPVAILYFYDLTGSIFFLIIDLQITTIKPENFPFEFWKYLN